MTVDEEQGKLIATSGVDGGAVEKAKEEVVHSVMEMAKEQSTSGLGSPNDEDGDNDLVKLPPNPKFVVHQDSWKPPEAHFPDDTIDDTYPLLDSIVAMRKVKGYVNGDNLMPTTTYSFIVSTNFRPNLVAVNLFVFFLQVFSYAAVVLNTFDFSSTSNPFQFPANVEGGRLTTFVSTFPDSICVQDGLINSLYTFRNGYDEPEIRRSFPDCAKSGLGLKIRWFIALGIILGFGLFAQFLTFVLIMQSESVLGVLLNYAAVSFISTIDNAVFALGKRGWIGNDVERQVRLVCLADEPDPGPKWYRRLAHTISLLVIFTILIISWIMVVGRQASGKYLCYHLDVQFSDEVNPSLGTYSGSYEIILERAKIFSADRSVYSERRSKLAHFGYCAEQDAWTFGFNVTNDEFEACDWAAKSTTTESFDIITTAISAWSGKNRAGRVIGLERADIACFDCATDSSLCGSHGTCNTGTNTSCVCDEGWFGRVCDLLAPCPRIQLDARLTTSIGSGDKNWAAKYEILVFENATEPILVYDYPVYVTETTPSGGVAAGRLSEYDIIFFTGRRWAISYASAFNPTNVDLQVYLENFHGDLTNYEASFLSEPVTPILENSSPLGLVWYFAKDNDNGRIPGAQKATVEQVDMGFLCSACDDLQNPCFFDGICGDDGICLCAEGATGSLCENPPVGDGKCDTYYNTLRFGMDGGDCCRATCMSTSRYKCGKDSTGFLDVGFSHCQSSDPLLSEVIIGAPLSWTGSVVAVSESGYFLAAVAQDRVVVYDKSGAAWSERRSLDFCNLAQNDEIRAMTMTNGPFLPNPFLTDTPFVVVASCLYATEPQLYYCSSDTSCSTQMFSTPEAADATYGSMISISQKADIVAIGSEQLVSISRATQSAQGGIVWSGGTQELIFPVKRNLSTGAEMPQVILAMSLAGDGSTVAIAASDVSNALDAQVHIYRFNGISWEERGLPIEVSLCPSTKVHKQDGIALLSHDGMRLLVSGGTNTTAFDWIEEAGEWNSVGETIVHAECSIKELTLAASGNQFAMGVILSDEVSEDETQMSRLLSYGWTGIEWEVREKGTRHFDVEADVAVSLSLSYNGRELAAGMSEFAPDLSGLVQTLEYPRTECENNGASYRVTMTIWPDTTAWSIVSMLNDTTTFERVGGGPYMFPNFAGAENVTATHHLGATVVQEFCIPKAPCHNFTMVPPVFVEGVGGAVFVQDGEIRATIQNEETFSAVLGDVTLPDAEYDEKYGVSIETADMEEIGAVGPVVPGCENIDWP
ncbi:MAG: hypothetical protein SGILL_005029 [Bacillariaceae sp.]